MAAVPQIFISATSRDLGSFRKAVADVLLTLGAHPVIQEHFAPDAGASASSEGPVNRWRPIKSPTSHAIKGTHSRHPSTQPTPFAGECIQPAGGYTATTLNYSEDSSVWVAASSSG